MTKGIMGLISAILTSTTAFAMGVQDIAQKTVLPKIIKVIWEGQEYTTTDEEEIENILTSDLVNDPKVIIKKSDVSSVQPTTISVVKER